MKKIIVYYSMSGNTDYVAKMISKKIDCDLIRLKPIKEYPSSGFRKFFWGGKSAVMKEMPKLCRYNFDYSKYDSIIFGTPIWASNYNPTIRTFINENKDKLSSMKKNVFICYSGSGGSKAIEKLRNDLGIEKFDNELMLIDPMNKKSKEKNIMIDNFIEKVG